MISSDQMEVDQASVERFMLSVDQRGPGECWPWKGSTANDRRGSFSFKGKSHTAPRVAWAIANGGRIPPRHLFACHSCDNPNCVNPNHLWLGTNRDNMRDAGRKGRCSMQVHPGSNYFGTPEGRLRRAKGSRHGSAKLDEAAVRKIKAALAAGAKHVDIAPQFGVTNRLIGLIANRKIWKHVEVASHRDAGGGE